MIISLRKKNSLRKGNMFLSLLIVFIIALLYFGSSNFHKTQIQTDECYKEISALDTYSQGFFEQHKESGIKDAELIKFENYIYDKWGYSIEVKTNLNEENRSEDAYFSLNLYTLNGNGEKIKFKNFFYE